MTDSPGEAETGVGFDFSFTEIRAHCINEWQDVLIIRPGPASEPSIEVSTCTHVNDDYVELSVSRVRRLVAALQQWVEAQG